MLVVTRNIGQRIIIGDDIIVTINEVNGNQVRIGVDAPKDLTIHREEIYLRIKNEKDGASKVKERNFNK